MRSCTIVPVPVFEELAVIDNVTETTAWRAYVVFVED